MPALSVLGTILALIGGIWLIILAFKESILWGLGCLFIPIISLVFVFMNWEDTKKPFLLNLVGVVLMVLPRILR